MMTAAATNAMKLAEAGLARQAAATSAGSLLGSFDAIADDILRGSDAFGATRLHTSVSDTKLDGYVTQVAEDAILRGDAGQGVADSLAGVLRLVDESHAFATLSGDTSMLRAIDNARRELRVAHAYVDFTVGSARGAAAGTRASTYNQTIAHDLGSLRGTSINGYRHGDELTIQRHLRRSLDAARTHLSGAQLLSANANDRIPAFESVAEITRIARAASGTVSGAGDLTMQRVEPLATAVTRLVDRIRSAHVDVLPGAFRVEGKHLQVDVATFDRAITTAEHAARDAKALLREIGDLVGTQDAHLHAVPTLRTAVAEMDRLDSALVHWRTIRDRTIARGEATGTVAAGGGIRFGTEAAYADAGAFTRNVDELVGRGDRLRRSYRSDPAAAAPRAASQPLGEAQAAVEQLRALAAAHAGGTADRSLLGTGTHATVDDAIAAVRGRYGSAEELQAALAAALG